MFIDIEMRVKWILCFPSESSAYYMHHINFYYMIHILYFLKKSLAALIIPQSIRSPVQGSADHLVRVGPRTDWFPAVDPWSCDWLLTLSVEKACSVTELQSQVRRLFTSLVHSWCQVLFVGITALCSQPRTRCKLTLRYLACFYTLLRLIQYKTRAIHNPSHSKT